MAVVLMLQISHEVCIRRASGDTGTPAMMTEVLPAQRTPSIRWVVEDTSITETTDLPAIDTAAALSGGTTGRHLLVCGPTNHRARSLPNLAEDEDWLRSVAAAGVKRKSDGETRPAAMATDVNTMTSSAVPVMSSVTSSSQLKPSSVSNSNNRMKRATSFAEHPVVRPTAVSSFPLFC